MRTPISKSKTLRGLTAALQSGEKTQRTVALQQPFEKCVFIYFEKTRSLFM